MRNPVSRIDTCNSYTLRRTGVNHLTITDIEKLDVEANSANLQTLEYVEKINNENFGGKLKILPAREYQDFYSSGKIGLSERTKMSNNLASLAIVSHELGHAWQDVSGNTLKKRNKWIRRGRLVGVLFVPLVVTAALFCLLWCFEFLDTAFLIAGLSCAGAAFLIFILSIIIKAREIRIEKEASKFALEFLSGYLRQDEIKECKELLDSARLTYWAGLLRTLLWWTGVSKKATMFG